MTINRRIVLLFAGLSLGSMLILGGLSWLVWQQQVNRQIAMLTVKEDHLLDVQAQDIGSDIKQLVYSLRFLADQVQLHRPYSDDEELTWFQEDMLSFLNTGELFDQVRLLDNSGMEIARVNYNAGKPAMVPANEMQAKGERYYFKDTIRLEYGQLYVSPMDLNVEQGKVALPIKPTMRLGMPVFDNEQKAGVVMLNYLAEHTLKRFRQAGKLSQGEISLLNAEGYWLSSAHPEQNWGFMFADRGDRRLEKTAPEVWQRMHDSDAGAFRMGGDLYTFISFDPLAGVKSIPGMRVSGKTARTTWLVISRLPHDFVAGVAGRIRGDVLLWSLPVGVMLLFTCWVLAVVMERRRLADRSLANSEERYRMVTQSASDAIVVADAAGHITAWNKAARTAFGYDEAEILGQPLTVLIPEQYRQAYEQGMQRFGATGEARIIGKTAELEALRKDGSEFPIELSLASWRTDHGYFYSANFRDISARKETDNMLLAAARMQATETMAGGIAHLINNQMAVVIGTASLIKMKLAGQEGLVDKLERIAVAGQQASHLAGELLAFSRGGSGKARSIDLNALIRTLADTNRQVVQPGIKEQWGLAHGLQCIKGDPEMLKQVFLALWNNAFEAMEDGGCISINTANIVMNGSSVQRYPGLKAGRYVRLSIRDTGCGMSRETLDRIFEPFFTTKFQGRGLGLAAAYGIVKQNGGYIYAESTPGEGASMDLFFPPAAELAITAEKVEWRTEGVTGGHETILLVDDDRVVREVNGEVLEDMGYTVLMAANGRVAVDVVRDYAGEIDLCMLDMDMPVMGGGEAFPLLKQARPNLKVLICSGFDHDANVQQVLDAGANGYLKKPYFPKELAAALRIYLH